MPSRLRIYWHLFSLIFINSLIHGQNLVHNPSLEGFTDCPQELGGISEKAQFWSRSSEGTSDYFHECSVALSVPKNFVGTQEAKHGSAYAGFYLLGPNNYREYLQVELTQTLEKGVKYEVSFYLSLAERSNYAIRDLAVLFTERKVSQPTRRKLSMKRLKDKNNSYNLSEIKNPNYLTDKIGWTRLSTTITAKGTENYLTIGNFKDDSQSKPRKVKGQKSAAYYFLDMVTLTSLQENYPLVENKIYELKNILFKTDNWALDETAKRALHKLYAELLMEESYYITVHAHTDNSGSLEYNKELSSMRAKAVAEYLMKLGLNMNRVDWIGHGGDLPLTDNDTEEGKRKNRRAEFTLSKEPLKFRISESVGLKVDRD